MCFSKKGLILVTVFSGIFSLLKLFALISSLSGSPVLTASSIGIIGGADGPTAIFVAGGFGGSRIISAALTGIKGIFDTVILFASLITRLPTVNKLINIAEFIFFACIFLLSFRAIIKS